MYPPEEVNPRLPRPIIIPNDMIVKMVDRFYEKVREHSILGPIFDTKIGDRWSEHMPKMYRFWSSVLNSSGLYSGNPMQKHKPLTDKVKPEYFTHWLDLFRETLEELFDNKDVEFIFEKAERIAQSLSLGMFYNPAAQR
ncbi:MAG: group III truncated hemoglobin [Sneathiella sp.]|nr:group III truncated hemoglobin [Sneathiella sp.]